jgi:uncharacterized DUF497 family protein
MRFLQHDRDRLLQRQRAPSIALTQCHLELQYSMQFEWDPQKATQNARKHGVTFSEAATVFGDPLARLADDPDHSEDNNRYILIGASSQRRLLFVAFAERGDTVRIISARELTRVERADYENS